MAVRKCAIRLGARSSATAFLLALLGVLAPAGASGAELLEGRARLEAQAGPNSKRAGGIFDDLFKRTIRADHASAAGSREHARVSLDTVLEFDGSDLSSIHTRSAAHVEASSAASDDSILFARGRLDQPISFESPGASSLQVTGSLEVTQRRPPPRPQRECHHVALRVGGPGVVDGPKEFAVALNEVDCGLPATPDQRSINRRIELRAGTVRVRTLSEIEIDTEPVNAEGDASFDLDLVLGCTNPPPTAPAPHFINGTPGDDVLCGTPQRDQIDGRGGNDVILAEGGNDTVFAGPGRDEVSGGPGDDHLEGDVGADTIEGGPGEDAVGGGEGGDDIKGGGGSDNIFGGDGGDKIAGGANGNKTEILVGDEGEDQIDGGAGEDKVVGQEGDDSLQGDDGQDEILGGPGEDIIGGGDRTDTIEGGNGADHIFGEGGGDNVDGGPGDDGIRGGEDGDLKLSGGPGKDEINGGPGRDKLRGGADPDRLLAKDGARDEVFGGAGRDKGKLDRIDGRSSVEVLL